MAVLMLSCLNAHAQSEEYSKTLGKLQADNQRLQAELANMKTAKESAEKTNQQLDAEIARLNSEVIAIRQASASILQIQNERDALLRKSVNWSASLICSSVKKSHRIPATSKIGS
jgi:predicted  nucleic acid-binding Zn-ribbon protein